MTGASSSTRKKVKGKSEGATHAETSPAMAELTPLNKLPASARELVPLLHALGYGSVEESLAVLQIAGRELVESVHISHQSLEAFAVAATSIASPITETEQELIDRSDYSLGVALDQIPALTVAPDLPLPSGGSGGGGGGGGGGGSPPPPPANVNLIPEMPPIRVSQGRRGTCVAFAGLAACEHVLQLNGTPVDLAEQFLYWNCKAHDGYSGSGTWLRVAYDRLYQDGCCLEDKWAYVEGPIAGNEGQGPPPGGAQVQALSYRLPQRYLTLAPTSVADLKATLSAGRCVSFSVPVYNTLMLNAQAKKTGDIPNPVPGELPKGGHAMCLVGFFDDASVPGWGGGRFILRNSWGTAFGFASAFGAGYGTISYAYIARLGREAFAVA